MPSIQNQVLVPADLDKNYDRFKNTSNFSTKPCEYNTFGVRYLISETTFECKSCIY